MDDIGCARDYDIYGIQVCPISLNWPESKQLAAEEVVNKGAYTDLFLALSIPRIAKLMETEAFVLYTPAPLYQTAGGIGTYTVLFGATEKLAQAIAQELPQHTVLNSKGQIVKISRTAPVRQGAQKRKARTLKP